ncbi:MAG: glycosyltransferase [Bacteroidota bacterium]
MELNLLDLLLYLFVAFAAVQVIYWLFYLIGIIRIKAVATDDKINPPPISVLVAAHNELDNLKVLIPALIEQDHPDYEVVIVDDRSTDDSYDFLIEQEQAHSKLKVVHINDLPSHISGKKYALTIGIKAARNKQVLLTDADCIPATTSWVSQMAAGFKNRTDLVLGFSNYKKLPGLLNYLIRFETLKTGTEYLASAGNNLPFMGVGRNLAYKKDLFLENKGFFGYQQVIGGDDDLFVNKHAKARNTTCAIGKEALTVSNPKTTWRSYWHQKIRHTYVGKYYSAKSKLGLALFNLSWIFTWILGITGLALNVNHEWIIYSLAIREILVIITFIIVTKKAGIAFEFWGLVFIDLLYSIYYIFVGIKALTTKTITWR